MNSVKSIQIYLEAMPNANSVKTNDMLRTEVGQRYEFC